MNRRLGSPVISIAVRPGLVAFLLLSMLLHVAVMGALGLLGTDGAVLPALGERHLVVELGELSVAEKPKRITTPMASDSPRPVSTEEAITAGSSGSVSGNQLIGEIQTRLSRFLTYPPLARARGWEGTVTLGFDLVPNGRLKRIHVASSSGYDVLDQAALEALIRMERLDTPGNQHPGTILAMRLPVIYRLTLH